MSKEKDIRNAIQAIVGAADYSTFAAKVTAIDGATCDVERVKDDKVFKGVRLNAHITADSGLVIVPTADSYVLVTEIDGDKWFVSQFSEIDKITIDFNDEIIINGGENDGIVKIKELTDKLNQLKDTVNSLVQSYNAHIHTTANAVQGAPVSINPTTSQAQQAQAFNKSDYENDKIKH
ncbi:MAG: hypothetical protein LBS50_10690 [Prevotellaceae bacterium]|jgi:hypothetical protein|nr:hypothetical protein [Prevotellaceae bacterium]